MAYNGYNGYNGYAGDQGDADADAGVQVTVREVSPSELAQRALSDK